MSRSTRNIFPGLPKSLHLQLEIYLKRHIFLRIPFFQACSVKHIIAIIPLVASEHMMPGRIILRQRSLLAAMYMVARGRVLLIKGEDDIVKRVFMMDFFGEEALLQGDKQAEWTAMAGDWCAMRPRRTGRVPYAPRPLHHRRVMGRR